MSFRSSVRPRTVAAGVLLLAELLHDIPGPPPVEADRSRLHPAQPIEPAPVVYPFPGPGPAAEFLAIVGQNGQPVAGVPKVPQV